MIVNLYILLLLPCQPPQQEGGVADDWLSSADGVQDGRYQMGGAKEDRTAKQYHRFDCRDQIPVDHMTMFAHHMTFVCTSHDARTWCADYMHHTFPLAVAAMISFRVLNSSRISSALSICTRLATPSCCKLVKNSCVCVCVCVCVYV